jgi:hypothetical protein
MGQCKVRAGQVYGRLTVMGRSENDPTGRPMFVCQCVCGRASIVRGNALRTGNTKSCGCLHAEWSKAWAPKMVRVFRQRPAGESALRAAFCATRQSARKRHLLFSISLEVFKNLSSLPCHYCGSAPSNLSRTAGGDWSWNGLDRVDSRKGYVIENVVPCCKICNRAKGALSVAEFKQWIAKVYSYGNKEKSQDV